MGQGSLEGGICFDLAPDMCYGFSHSQDSQVHKPKGKKREPATLIIICTDPLGKNVSCLWDRVILVLNILLQRGSTPDWKYNKHSFELEAQTFPLDTWVSNALKSTA